MTSEILELDVIDAAIQKMAKAISDRYRNGVTVVGITGGSEQLVGRLSFYLDAMRCIHMVGFVTTKVVDLETRKGVRLIANPPSLHLLRKKHVVILDGLLDAQASLSVGKFMLEPHQKPRTLECGCLVSTIEPTPQFVSKDLVGFSYPTADGFRYNVAGFGIGGSEERSIKIEAIDEVKSDERVGTDGNQ